MSQLYHSLGTTLAKLLQFSHLQDGNDNGTSQDCCCEVSPVKARQMLRTVFVSHHQQAEIGHDGSVYTLEMGRCYESEVLPTRAIGKHLPVATVIFFF